MALRHLVLHACITATALCTLLACHPAGGKIPESGEQGGEVDSTLRIALLPTVEALPLYVAQAEGLFDSLGLRVELLTFQAAMDADTAFWHGTAQGLLTDGVKVALWQRDSLPVHVLLRAPLQIELIVHPGTGIKRPADLKDKIIALTRLSSLDYVADGILQAGNLAGTDLNRPQINDITLRKDMTLQGQVDGALLPQPFAAIALAHGARRVPTRGIAGRTGAALILREGPRLNQVEPRLIEAYDLACGRINARGTPALARLPLDELPPDSLFSMPAMGRATTAPDSLNGRLSQWALRREQLLRPDNDEE